MNEQWKQLKDTIVDIRDNNEFEHEDVTLMCRFLVNYMEVLEKQMQEPCKNTIDRQAVLDIVDSYSESQSNVEDVTQDIISDIMVLPSVNLQPCENAISRQSAIFLASDLISSMTEEERKLAWMYKIFDKDMIKAKTEQWTKEAEKAGMTLTEYLEFISPLAEGSDKNDTN